MGNELINLIKYKVKLIPLHIYRWLKKKKDLELTYSDDEYLVEDETGVLITQKQHKEIYGFSGYPSTHLDTCVCFNCTTTRDNYYRIRTQHRRSKNTIDKNSLIPKKNIRQHEFKMKETFFDSEQFLIKQRNYINSVKQSLGLIRDNE